MRDAASPAAAPPRPFRPPDDQLAESATRCQIAQFDGQAFAALVAQAVDQGEWTDILAGLDAWWLRVSRTRRLGIAGRSHGGFMAARAVSQTGRFRAAGPAPARKCPGMPDT